MPLCFPSLEQPLVKLQNPCLKNGRLVLVLWSGYETRLAPISLFMQHTDDELTTSSNVKTSLLSNLAWPLTPGDQNSSLNSESIIESRVQSTVQSRVQSPGFVLSLSLVPRPSHPCSFCHLHYEKQGEGLEGFIMWCVPLLISHSVCSHLGLFSPLHSSFPEFSSFFLFSLSCESDCYWIDRG